MFSPSQSINERDTNTIQAVIFDLDGVLMDSEWIAFHVWQEVARKHGGHMEESLFPVMAGMTAEDTAVYIMQQTGTAFSVPESVDWVWRRVMETFQTGIQPLPGSQELLRWLRRHGYPLAIASNSFSEYIESALHGLGVAEYFPVRVGIDQVAQGKPAPDVYLAAARRLGIAPERCLAVEDSRVGVQAAAAAGMRVIAVPNRRDHHNGFHGAWRVYPSLEAVNRELDTVLG